MKRAAPVLLALLSAASLGLSGCGEGGDAGVSAEGLWPMPVTDRDEGVPPQDPRRRAEWESMRGLAFEGGRVSVDAAAAAELDVAGTPEDAAARVAEGLALLQENRRTEAVGAMRDAVLMAPDAAFAYDALGRALITKRKDDLAAAAFATAVGLDGEDAGIRARYADALNRVGDREAARGQYRAALELDPAAGDAHKRLAVLLYYAGDLDAARRHAALAEEHGSEVPPQLLALLAGGQP